MAIYEVQDPQGNKYRVEGPEGASAEEVLSQVQAYSQHPIAAEETDEQKAARARGELVPKDEGYFAGLGQAAAGASKSTAGGIMQLAGAEESGRELTLAGRAQGKNYPSISDLPALYRQEGLWESVKAAPRAISYDVARTAPVIATGVAAGALAPEVALGGLGAATLAELGVYGLSATGENINRQADQIAAGTRTEFDRGAAVASGLAQGVLEKVGINQILGKAGAIGERVAKTLGTKTAAEEILQASTRTGLGTTGRVIGGIAGTGAIEGGVEATQEALSRAQAGESLTDREALEAYGTSALGGVLVGGTMRAPFATVEGMSSKDRALSKIEYFGNVGLDVLTDQTALTPEFFKENGRLMAEGVARNTAGSENAKTVDQAFDELKSKVKTQEQFDAELAKMQEEAARDKESKPLTEEEEFFKQRAEAKAAEAQAAELPAGRPDILYGQQEGVPLTPEQQAKRVIEFNEKRKKKEEKAAAAGYKKFSQEDMFGGYEGPQQRQQITPEEVEAEGINKRQEDIFGYKPLNRKLPKEDAALISPELRGATLPVSVEGEVLSPEQAAAYAEAIPFREAAQEKQQAALDEQAKIQAEKQKKLIEKNEADTAKKVAKLKPGETLDIFGGKKGTIKEEVIPEPKAVEEISPLKQVDVVDEAKRLEVPNLVTALKGLTKTAEGGPHPDTLLGKEPVGQRKATDFATAVHAEVGAKDTDVITPDHVAKANIKDLEVGKLVERAGGLPISDPKVSAAINKLTPEKQKALIDVLSKDYTPENYIKPSEMLVSKADVLNLGLRPQSGLVKELFTSPKVEAINVINDPKGAKKLIGALKKVAEVNKNTPTAVKAKELYENIDRTLAKVKVANNKAVAAKAKTQDSYSVAPTGITTGHTAASLSKALSPELKRLVASGKAVLHDTADTLPGTGHPANVKGMTTAEGVTHYVANKLTPSTIESVALHEVGVHAGMAKMLGNKLWSYVKDQAMTNQGDAFVKARAAVPKGTPDHLVAEEALAYLVENSPNLSLVRQIVASIRNFLRAKLGANIRLSEADARQMAVDAIRREAKTAVKTAREETAFSKEKLLAPNGKPSNLNAMQHAQVRTPEFKKWFGGWENDPENASKVVDENGEPLVVYHSTNNDFTMFDLNKIGSNGLALGPSFYFTNSKNVSSAWGNKVISAYLKMDNPTLSAEKKTITKGQVSKIISDLEKEDPEFLSNYGDVSYEGHRSVLNSALEDIYTMSKNDSEIIGSLINVGGVEREKVMQSIITHTKKDGFIVDAKLASHASEQGDKVYAVLTPTQIKSATDNTGAFSAENPDIRYSVNKDGFDENVPKIRKKANAIASFNREKLPSYLELFSAAGIREIGAKYLRGKPSEDGTPSKNSASEILKDTRKITGMTNKLLEEYLDLRKQINKYIKENRRQVGILGDTANSATILQVSPSEINPDSPNNIDNRIESELANQKQGYAQRVKDLKALKVRWGQLTPQSKLMYNKLADFYKKSYQDYIDAELSRIDTAEISEEKKERQRDIFTKKMKHTQLKGDYFPVMRFGNYAVQYTDGDIDEDTGELIPKFSKFESEEEAREFIDNNPSIETKGVTKDILRDNSSVLTGNRSLDALWKSVDKKFEKIESTEDIAIVADEMKDYLFQMHLMGRPEQSIAKRFLHRKGTAGYSNDIFRSFDTYALSMSKQLPRIELSNNIMAKLDNLRHELPTDKETGGKGPIAADYYNAFKKQITDSVYPKQLNGAINTITGAVFHYYLSAPASAALQLASIPLQGAPSIAKVHGVNAARRALNSAVGLYTSSMSKKTPFGDIKRGAEARKDTIGNLVTGAKHADEFDLPDAMDKMRAEGLLLPSVHAQAFSGQNKPTSKSDSAFAKAKRVMEITSRPFAEAESAARQVSAAAAYIANMRSGMTHQEAIRSAIDTTYLDLGDFGATGQSSLVKTGFGGMVKIASQFQQYGAKLLFAFGKAGYDALKGESPEVRRQGIKFLGSLYAMHWLFAGALGLPGAGLAMSITDFIRDIVGDKDERHSLEQDMRNAMRSSGLNNTVVKMILDGPIGTITNMNLTPRIGAGDLIPMIQESDLNETLKGDVVGDFGKTMLGAAGSTAANIMKASEAWTEGNYEQAIEKIMPAAIRNVMTAHRYATEGKLTPKGLPIVSKEEISTWDVVARALGMETMHMAEKSKAARSAHMLDKFIDDRKEFLYDKFAKATPKEQEKVINALVKFAERHPGAGVSTESILSSLRGREEAKYKAIRGQMLGKNKAEVEEYIPELGIDED